MLCGIYKLLYYIVNTLIPICGENLGLWTLLIGN
jgi:hypothetical protein